MKTKKYSREEAASAAAQALANLTVFAAVKALLEGGLITWDSDRAAGRIIGACNKECDRQLRLFDKNMEAVKSAE